MAIFKSISFVFVTTLFLLSLFLFISPTESLSRRFRMNKRTVIHFLNAHDHVRSKHNLPRLKWSALLAKYAIIYGESPRRDCALTRSTWNFSYGENIFWGEGRKLSEDAVAAWAAQEAYYNYTTNECLPGKECLYYTQLVWRTTRRIGCAQLRCNNGTFIICEYGPPGNVMGQKPY